MARSLEADREAARYTDEQIRRQTADVTASPSAAPPSAPEAPPSPSPPADTPAAEARPAPPSPPRRAAVPHQPVPVEVQNVEPAAGGQTAAVPAGPLPPMPAAPPPPPAIPPVVAAGQPIPVDPAPAQPAYSVPAVPPATVEVAPGGERTAFVRPDPFSTRFPTGAGTIRGPRTLNPPPPAAAPDFAQGQSPGFATAPVERFAPDGPPVATVYFNAGSAKIGARGRRAIRDAFRAWQSRGGRIRIVGHASSRTRNMDRVSHELANFRVSDERARAVAREVIRLGVNPSAIVVEAVSDHEPAFQEVMPAGEAGNRRAEILLEN
jgi:outer membrane protein OmpA-like peptidoglycan-associated protein